MPFTLLRESPVGMIGAGIVAFWVLVASFAPLIAPFDPNASIQPMASPMSEHAQGVFYLGTDHLGRDILSRLVWGSRTVLFYAPLATAAAYLAGIAMGLAAGYYRGWVDDVLSRLADIILSFPVLVLYIIVIATIGPSALNIVIAIVFASAPGIMRIVRGLVLDLRNRDYVAAAQTRGEGAWRIMLVEILPNARGPLVVDACLRLGYVIITIGVLGFLGLGLPPPDPDWGGMINETRAMALVFPHMTLIPCLAISSLILGFNLLADGLREISLRD
jgi:peptide/nickel transport system permease protein